MLGVGGPCAAEVELAPTVRGFADGVRKHIGLALDRPGPPSPAGFAVAPRPPVCTLKAEDYRRQAHVIERLGKLKAAMQEQRHEPAPADRRPAIQEQRHEPAPADRKSGNALVARRPSASDRATSSSGAVSARLCWPPSPTPTSCTGTWRWRPASPRRLSRGAASSRRDRRGRSPESASPTRIVAQKGAGQKHQASQQECYRRVDSHETTELVKTLKPVPGRARDANSPTEPSRPRQTREQSRGRAAVASRLTEPSRVRQGQSRGPVVAGEPSARSSRPTVKPGERTRELGAARQRTRESQADDGSRPSACESAASKPPGEQVMSRQRTRETPTAKLPNEQVMPRQRTREESTSKQPDEQVMSRQRTREKPASRPCAEQALTGRRTREEPAAKQSSEAAVARQRTHEAPASRTPGEAMAQRSSDGCRQRTRERGKAPATVARAEPMTKSISETRQGDRRRPPSARRAAAADSSRGRQHRSGSRNPGEMGRERRERSRHGRGDSELPEREKFNAASHWNWSFAEDFHVKLTEAKQKGDALVVQQLLKEVAEDNERKHACWPVPQTEYIRCRRESSQSRSTSESSSSSAPRPSSRTKRLQITLSRKLLCDALVHFAQQGRQVAGVSCADGVRPGGGYLEGACGQEEDLCRRIPALHASLVKAQKKGLYPFGPQACSEVQAFRRHSDVLWTPDVTVARKGEEDGFELFRKCNQVQVSLVSAASPANSANGVDDSVSMHKTIEAAVNVPHQKQPGLEVLVLGAWGCGAFGDPHAICELFARVLQDATLPYDEVHFAIPGKRQCGIFFEVLRKSGLNARCASE